MEDYAECGSWVEPPQLKVYIDAQLARVGRGDGFNFFQKLRILHQNVTVWKAILFKFETRRYPPFSCTALQIVNVCRI